MSKNLKIRFRDFPKDNSRFILTKLMELVYEVHFVETESEHEKVEVEITGPYSGDSDSFKTPILKRAMRGILSEFSPGGHLSFPSLATGIRPNPLAKVNIWYTGENQRPPYGEWDAFLSFDNKFPSEKNFYLPLWLLTSTDFVFPIEYSYWGKRKPTIEELTKPREKVMPKKKFACAFFGKNYRLRLHALDALRKIGEVDVFGEGARRPVENPYLIASKYKFTLCFENDLYPGYVTEKPIEAYLAQTIPIYYGIDSEKYLNPSAILNLHDFESERKWLQTVHELHSDREQYNEVFTEPLLLKRPLLEELLISLRRTLLNV